MAIVARLSICIFGIFAYAKIATSQRLVLLLVQNSVALSLYLPMVDVSLQMNEEQKDGQVIDIPQLMTEIRAKVAAELASGQSRPAPFKPMVAEQDRAGHRKAGEITRSEQLYYLNSNWRIKQSSELLSSIKSHRAGILGKIIVKLKRWILTAVWDGALKEHLEAEEQYRMRLVQLLNELALYTDDRDASNFWELVRKIDYDVAKALTRIERINDDQTGSLRAAEQNLTESFNQTLTELNHRITALQGRVERVDETTRVTASVASGLEGIVGRLTQRQVSAVDESKVSSMAGTGQAVPDFTYLMLENRFRGSEEEIRNRLGVYLSLFKNAPGRVLEIGAGRGELQLLFKESGVESYGIDIDEGMVSVAHERGANVKLADAVSHLSTLEDGSLGGVVAIQVVEHLTVPQLRDLLSACAKKVAKGGIVSFETINPRSLLALSSNYFRDPTHVSPLHPDTLSYACTLAGLKVREVKMLSPVPDEAKLKEIPTEQFMTPRWAHLMALMNTNVRQLNEMLFGYQDYAVVAEVT